MSLLTRLTALFGLKGDDTDDRRHQNLSRDED